MYKKIENICIKENVKLAKLGLSEHSFGNVSIRVNNDLFFINPNEGWVVGGHGTVLHTINGGKVWRPQQCETQFNLNTIHMMNPKLGWIAGDLGTILRHKVIGPI